MMNPILGAAEKGFWMPPAASDYAKNVDALFNFILWLSVFFFVVLMWLTVQFAWKYRKQSETQRSSPLAHNFKLEFLWSAIPTVLLVVIFAWGFQDFTALSAAPPDALKLRVVAKQWQWSIAYPQLDRECTPVTGADNVARTDIYLPVGQPFTVQMSSDDVLHSFWIPAFRVKRDVLPNRYTGFTVTPTEEGTYPFFCAEYCGDNHSAMMGDVHVLSVEKWEEWKKGEQCKLDPKAPDYKPKLFAKHCSGCHSIEPDVIRVGPSLYGKFGTTEHTNQGDVEVNEDYVRESIEYPEKKKVSGFESKNMTSFRGRLKEAELAALIDYVKSLGAGGGK